MVDWWSDGIGDGGRVMMLVMVCGGTGDGVSGSVI